MCNLLIPLHPRFTQQQAHTLYSVAPVTVNLCLLSGMAFRLLPSPCGRDGYCRVLDIHGDIQKGQTNNLKTQRWCKIMQIHSFGWRHSYSNFDKIIIHVNQMNLSVRGLLTNNKKVTCMGWMIRPKTYKHNEFIFTYVFLIQQCMMVLFSCRPTSDIFVLLYSSMTS